MNLLTFRVGDDLYGVELDAVESVVRSVDRAGGREEEGVRLDLAERWGGDRRGRGSEAEVRLRTERGTVQLGVDGLGEVVHTPRSGLMPLPRFFTSEVLRGVVPVAEQLVVVLDAEQLMRLADETTVLEARGDRRARSPGPP